MRAVESQVAFGSMIGVSVSGLLAWPARHPLILAILLPSSGFGPSISPSLHLILQGLNS